MENKKVTKATATQVTSNNKLLKEIELLKAQLQELKQVNNNDNFIPVVGYQDLYIGWEYGKSIVKNSQGVTILECCLSKKGKPFIIDSFSPQSLKFKEEKAEREILKAKQLLGIE